MQSLDRIAEALGKHHEDTSRHHKQYDENGRPESRRRKPALEPPDFGVPRLIEQERHGQEGQQKRGKPDQEHREGGVEGALAHEEEYDAADRDARVEPAAESANHRKNPEAFQDWVGRGRPAEERLESSEEIGRLEMIMIGILVVAVILWGTEALPIGGTAVLVAVLMYVFGILSVHEIPKAFMNDAVFFILGILAIAVGVRKTGLDRRIGLLLLSRIGSVRSFAFIFFPLMAIASGFLSAHALVALLVPVMMGVYKSTCAANGVKQDRVLAIFLLLGLCYAANVGGPGSPAGGARNVIMVGYLADAGLPIGFGDWMKFGLPLVPVLALTVGAYMYARCAPKLYATSMDPTRWSSRSSRICPRSAAKRP